MIGIRPMTADDVPFGMILKTAANWNQTEDDWRRALELEPQGCFVGLCDGTPAATLTTAVFGDAAWVAMVLTHPDFRGRGLATALLKHAIQWLADRGVTTIRLDATAMGRPVYEKLGFRVVAEEARYCGVVRSGATDFAAGGANVARFTNAMLSDAAILDEPASGNDRSRLLRLLFRDWPDAALAVPGSSSLLGYCLARRGSRAPQIGPCVAADMDAGRRLLTSALAGFAGRLVYVDVPGANPYAAQLAEEYGLTTERTFFRMALGPDVRVREEAVWANCGPEKG